MCGIAGYSLDSRSDLERTLAAQALLAAIAERGADAVGYAYRAPSDTYLTVVKQRTPASLLLAAVEVRSRRTQPAAHVAHNPTAHPSLAPNTRPVGTGPSRA